MGKIKSICVFCGSSKGKDPLYLETAYKLGNLLAENNIEMVYGGGNVGLMGMAAKGALDRGGRVTGVIPEKLKDMEVAHNGLTELKVVKTMHERKSMMNDLSGAFISMPGGIGTIEETFEIFTWFQLGYINKPIGILNVSGFFDQLLKFLENTVNEGFLRKEHFDTLVIENDPDSLLKELLNFNHIPIEKWFDREKNIIN
ncbi:MAG: TIGR00730 family Rossman fold protein [Acidobacteriota bacterium]